MKLPSVSHIAGTARALRTLRAYRGIGQRELSARSGFSWGVISKWERGKSGIIPPHRQILAQALEVPEEVFIVLARHGDPLTLALEGFFPMTPPSKLYTYDEASRKLHICKNTIRKGVTLGIVRPRRGDRRVWFTAEDLERLAAWRRDETVRTRGRIRQYQKEVAHAAGS